MCGWGFATEHLFIEELGVHEFVDEGLYTYSHVCFVRCTKHLRVNVFVGREAADAQMKMLSVYVYKYHLDPRRQPVLRYCFA